MHGGYLCRQSYGGVTGTAGQVWIVWMVRWLHRHQYLQAVTCCVRWIDLPCPAQTRPDYCSWGSVRNRPIAPRTVHTFHTDCVMCDSTEK